MDLLDFFIKILLLIKKIFFFFIKEIFLSIFRIILFIFILTLFFTGLFNLDNDSSVNKSYETLILNPSNIPENKTLSYSLFSTLTGESGVITFSDIIQSLNYAQKNTSIKNIVIDIDSISLTASQIEELTKVLENLKNSGLNIYSYGSYYSNSNYNLALVSNEIIATPSNSASVSLTGYNYSDFYYKTILDKVGFSFDIIRNGDFKSYGENYTLTEMSPELREELTRILESRFDSFINKVSTYRNLNDEKLKTDILNGDLFDLTPFEARDKNLIDTLLSRQDFLERIKSTNDNTTDIYSFYSENQANINSNEYDDSVIAVIPLSGTIVQDGTENISADIITPSIVESKLEEAVNIANITGIVLRIDSGGGSALASEEIYQIIQKYKINYSNIPFYVSMSSSAASGGYYIASAGDKIFADESTITGSIGVVSMFPKYYEAANRLGVNQSVISKGKFSNIYDPMKPFTQEEREKISKSMVGTYNEFKTRVSQSRSLSLDIVEEIAQGKIWTGEEAKINGLVNDIASLTEVIEIMKDDLNLNAVHQYNVYTNVNFVDRLSGAFRYIAMEKISTIFSPKTGYNQNITDKLANEYEILNKLQGTQLYYMPIKF